MARTMRLWCLSVYAITISEMIISAYTRICLKSFLIAIRYLDIDDKSCGIAAVEVRLLACWLGSRFHNTRRHTTLTLINTGKV